MILISKKRLFLALATTLTVCACARPSILPPDLADEQKEWSSSLTFPNEPPIWQVTEPESYQRRIRLFMFAPTMQNAAIRIDTDLHGKTTGHVVLMRYRSELHRDVSVTNRIFSVDQSDLVTLNTLISQSTLWTIYPEHWINKDPNKVCVDGVQILMERAEHQQYRFSEANAQCTAPNAMLKIAAKMIEMAALHVADWLD